MVTLTRPRPAAGRNPRAKGEILARLRSAEGHLRGIHRMINEDRYSVDVLKQTKAVQRAIDKVNVLVLERHLNHCVSGGIRLEDPQERERVVSELLDVLEDGTGNKR
ncbi:MAG: metal-sensitive transcriptional regulator [Bacillati bacterium ANGP1]|uniref:Metal-sensitive transcriptional regulator n=1 Tax=Candidatus Segetimicrobium genomatis TaxID=2569760 RepID=A0A537JV48_9BACT|nr:MAG: metal-sensitive transcriptional regulator [Terrabacteria group bacterium ANGP1]